MISQDDEQKVTPDNPKDFSSYIENPDFATSTTGWTKEGTAKTFEVNGWVPATVTDVMVAPALNLWGNNQNIHVSQIVENLHRLELVRSGTRTSTSTRTWNCPTP